MTELQADLQAGTTEIDEEEPAESHLRQFEKLHAASSTLTIAVALLFAVAAPRSEVIFPTVAILGIALGVFAVAWHRLMPAERRGATTLLIDDVVLTLGAAALILFSGGAMSPLFFLFYPPIVLAGLTVGSRAGFGTAALAALAFIVVSDLAEPAATFVQSLNWWANVAAIFIVGVTAGLLGAEVNKNHARLAEDKEKAERFSSVDWLTGLYNRRHLEYIMPQEIARARRHDRPVSLLIVDADHLKEVNDQLGHLKGDELLTHLAEVLTAQMRLVDTVIRFGGDEFVVIMPDTDTEGALIPAQRIRATMSDFEISANGVTVKVSISAGLATFPRDADDGPSLLACADSALYVSKRNGRDQVTVYMPEFAGVTEPVGRG